MIGGKDRNHKETIDEFLTLVLFAGRQVAFGQAAARICSCATGNHIYFGRLEVGHVIKLFIQPFRLCAHAPNPPRLWWWHLHAKGDGARLESISETAGTL